MARPKTQNLGAQRERDCIRAKIARMIAANEGYTAGVVLNELRQWLNARSRRFRDRKGGL